MLEIEYEFREQDLIHFNETQFANHHELQQAFKRNRFMVPAAIIIIGLFYYFYYKDIQVMIYSATVGLLWILFLPKMLRMDLRRKILRNYTDAEKAHLFGGYTLRIDPADPKYLFEKSPSGKNKMLWSELIRVEYHKGYVYIYLSLDTALVIPLETVKKGDLKQFAEQVENMIERAAD